MRRPERAALGPRAVVFGTTGTVALDALPADLSPGRTAAVQSTVYAAGLGVVFLLRTRASGRSLGPTVLWGTALDGRAYSSCHGNIRRRTNVRR